MSPAYRIAASLPMTPVVTLLLRDWCPRHSAVWQTIDVNFFVRKTGFLPIMMGDQSIVILSAFRFRADLWQLVRCSDSETRLTL